MVEFWISIPSGALQEIGAERLKGLIQSADTVLLSDQELETIRRLGAKSIAAPGSGEIRLVDGLSGIQAATGEGASTALRISVKGKDDEDRVMEAAKSGVRYLLVDCPDWKIIPLENLIARLRGSGVKLIASVNGADEAKTAIETLELGVDGVLLNSIDESEVSRTAALIKKAGSRLEIVEAEVVDKKLLSLGARVCIDTCNIMKPGEGLLVGSQSSGLFLVQAEVIPNPHVEPRPFRVNAGTVSSYVLKPGEKTQYLSELKAGDEVLIVNRMGETSVGNVGRVKIEMRPQILIEATYRGKVFKVILQHAETIHLVTKEGSKSVVDLKPRDKVLIRYQEGGRHFGMLVPEEMVIEK